MSAAGQRASAPRNKEEIKHSEKILAWITYLHEYWSANRIWKIVI